MAKNKFEKSAESSLSGSGTYIRDGRYVLVVDKVYEIEEGYEGDSIVAELIVLKAEANGELELDKDQKTPKQPPVPVQPNPVGSTISAVFNFKKQPDMAPKNYKKFVLGVMEGLGATESAITAAELQKACSEKNPLHGIAVSCETNRIAIKGKQNAENAGKLITVPVWRGISHGATDEERTAKIRAMREKIAKVRAGASVGPAAPAAQAAPPVAAAAKPREDVQLDALEVPAAPAEQEKQAEAPAPKARGVLALLDD